MKRSDGPQTVHVLEDYYARVDGFGRLYFDKCPSDAEHLLAQAPEGKERPGCRIYASDLIDTLGGKKGSWKMLIVASAKRSESEELDVLQAVQRVQPEDL